MSFVIEVQYFLKVTIMGHSMSKFVGLGHTLSRFNYYGGFTGSCLRGRDNRGAFRRGYYYRILTCADHTLACFPFCLCSYYNKEPILNVTDHRSKVAIYLSLFACGRRLNHFVSKNTVLIDFDSS